MAFRAEMVEEQVLRKVFEQGGFAYASLVSMAAEGDECAAEAAHEMAWEQLHSGPWHAVHPAWRDAYSLACLRLAAHHQPQQALRVLDMGLLMGGLLLKPHIHSAISQAQQLLKNEEENTQQGEEQPEGRGADVGGGHYSPLVTANLPPGSLHSLELSRRSLLTVEEFLCNYFMTDVPVIITNAMAHWPAMTKWKNLGYFTEVVGNRTVPVEVGEHYLASGWKQELMPMYDFLKRLQVSDSCSNRAYLAQHPLFEQIPKLQEDIRVPDYCAATGGDLKVINAWLGPKETVTPLHHDPHHNLLCQVVGQKYVRLYPPQATSSLYPFSETMLCNSSQVDLDNPDYAKFPLAQNLSFMDCVLEEGEMLYIPPKWWHYVKSLSLSFSVSFWWSADNDDE